VIKLRSPWIYQVISGFIVKASDLKTIFPKNQNRPAVPFDIGAVRVIIFWGVNSVQSVVSYIVQSLSIGDDACRRVSIVQESRGRGLNRIPIKSTACGLHRGFESTKPALFTALPAAAPPGPVAAAFRSVAHPHRTGEYASGALGHETPQPQDLPPPRDGRVVNKAG